MEVLRAKNVNKYFYTPEPFHVLKDVSFAIDKGEFVSIMGKSGCGKSTLLYILSTVDTSYDGELYINENIITGQSADNLATLRNKHIGFIFQFHYLLPEFSVLQNVSLPAKKLGLKSSEEIEHDAVQILTKLGVSDQAMKLSSKVSGGQKQRIAIARALINNPDIVMGDEPTGNLDTKNSENVFSILRELSDEFDLSLLVVTHDTDFAAKTDRIITMENGRVIDEGRQN